MLQTTSTLGEGFGKGNMYIASGGTLDLFTQTGQGINGLWGGGTVLKSNTTGNNAPFYIGSANASSTFGGNFSTGPASFYPVKIGLGTLTLTGTSSFYASDPLTVSGGMVVLQGDTGVLSGGTNTGLTFNFPTGVANGDPGVGQGVFPGVATLGFNYTDGSPTLATSQAMGTLSFTTGDGVVQSTRNGSYNHKLTFSSLARGSGGTGNFIVSGGTNGATDSTGNSIVISGASQGFLNPGVFFNGADYAAVDAGGFVRALLYGTDSNTLGSMPLANSASLNVLLTLSVTSQPSIARARSNSAPRARWTSRWPARRPLRSAPPAAPDRWAPASSGAAAAQPPSAAA